MVLVDIHPANHDRNCKRANSGGSSSGGGSSVAARIRQLEQSRRNEKQNAHLMKGVGVQVMNLPTPKYPSRPNTNNHQGHATVPVVEPTPPSPMYTLRKSLNKSKHNSTTTTVTVPTQALILKTPVIHSMNTVTSKVNDVGRIPKQSTITNMKANTPKTPAINSKNTMCDVGRLPQKSTNTNSKTNTPKKPELNSKNQQKAPPFQVLYMGDKENVPPQQHSNRRLHSKKTAITEATSSSNIRSSIPKCNTPILQKNSQCHPISCDETTSTPTSTTTAMSTSSRSSNIHPLMDAHHPPGNKRDNRRDVPQPDEASASSNMAITSMLFPILDASSAADEIVRTTLQELRQQHIHNLSLSRSSSNSTIISAGPNHAITKQKRKKSVLFNMKRNQIHILDDDGDEMIDKDTLWWTLEDMKQTKRLARRLTLTASGRRNSNDDEETSLEHTSNDMEDPNVSIGSYLEAFQVTEQYYYNGAGRARGMNDSEEMATVINGLSVGYRGLEMFVPAIRRERYQRTQQTIRNVCQYYGKISSFYGRNNEQQQHNNKQRRRQRRKNRRTRKQQQHDGGYYDDSSDNDTTDYDDDDDDDDFDVDKSVMVKSKDSRQANDHYDSLRLCHVNFNANNGNHSSSKSEIYESTSKLLRAYSQSQTHTSRHWAYCIGMAERHAVTTTTTTNYSNRVSDEERRTMDRRLSPANHGHDSSHHHHPIQSSTLPGITSTASILTKESFCHFDPIVTINKKTQQRTIQQGPQLLLEV